MMLNLFFYLSLTTSQPCVAPVHEWTKTEKAIFITVTAFVTFVAIEGKMDKIDELPFK